MEDGGPRVQAGRNRLKMGVWPPCDAGSLEAYSWRNPAGVRTK